MCFNLKEPIGAGYMFTNLSLCSDFDRLKSDIRVNMDKKFSAS
jgi:hypothetical protein